MQVHAGVIPQPLKIPLNKFIVLPATDAGRDLFVECLDADFELQRSGRELGNHFAESIRCTIGNQPEMQEQSRCITLQEKVENGPADAQVEIERAIDKF